MTMTLDETKMKPEIKAEWLDALRSGEYQQASGKLYDAQTGGYCCLGVLCDLAERRGIVSRTADGDGTVFFGSAHAIVDDDGVQEWAGLVSPNPEVPDPDYVDGKFKTSLAGLNDEGKTFAELADMIERYL
jgi:hypothetical protein